MKKITKKRRASVLFLEALLTVLLVIPIKAEKNSEDITICYQGKENEKEMFLEDMSVKLYRIGSSGVGGTLADDFKESGLSLENLESLPISELQKEAEKTADYAHENGILGEHKKTDEKGEVSFEELAYGLYLVVPQSRYEIEKGSFLLSPFFVNLPLDDEEAMLYPKVEWEEKKPEKTENETDFNSAKTGDSSFNIKTAVLGIISGCVIVVCLSKRKNGNKI